LVYDKETGETDWDYLRRKAPELYDALHGIAPYFDAAEEVFDQRNTIWNADSRVDLCTRMLIAGLKVELDELREQVSEALEEKKGWRVLLRQRDGVIFQSPMGDTAWLPNEILDVLVHDRAFDGTVDDAGSRLRFLDARGEELVMAPKTLISELRGQRLSLPSEG
jgi:hypothetical protein